MEIPMCVCVCVCVKGIQTVCGPVKWILFWIIQARLVSGSRGFPCDSVETQEHFLLPAPCDVCSWGKIIWIFTRKRTEEQKRVRWLVVLLCFKRPRMKWRIRGWNRRMKRERERDRERETERDRDRQRERHRERDRERQRERDRERERFFWFLKNTLFHIFSAFT